MIYQLYINIYKKISLNVRETNIPAIKCYEKCGFVIKSKGKEYFFDGKNYIIFLII
jgi:ribosomal protein S18 acetylase RimI-like enzyme